jgi:hypothetical protein
MFPAAQPISLGQPRILKVSLGNNKLKIFRPKYLLPFRLSENKLKITHRKSVVLRVDLEGREDNG